MAEVCGGAAQDSQHHDPSEEPKHVKKCCESARGNGSRLQFYLPSFAVYMPRRVTMIRRTMGLEFEQRRGSVVNVTGPQLPFAKGTIRPHSPVKPS